MEKKKNNHGGARKGAGRKTKEPTIVIRIPKSLLKKVGELIRSSQLYNRDN